MAPQTLPLPAVAPAIAGSADAAAAYDALCFVQSPATVNQLASLLAAAGMRTARGTGFHSPEVRKLLDGLAAAGLALSGDQGRWLPSPASGWARFKELIADDKLRAFWWRAWKADRRFEHTYGLELRDEAALAGAMRVVIHAGRTRANFERLRQIAYSAATLGPGALRRAMLQPFDGALMARLEPQLQMTLVGWLLDSPGGDTDPDDVPLHDWLLALARSDPKALPEPLHYRLAEWLIFCYRGDEARALLNDRATPEAQALRAALEIAQGHFESGATAFEAAWKALGTEVGRRKRLLPESLSWFYPMALLASPEPAAWSRARKFAVAESGQREPPSYTFWGIWREAIDQRLGDAPRSAEPFQLDAQQFGREPHALQSLHRLLLAAWLGVGPTNAAAAARLRQRGQSLAQRFDASAQRWLATLARRAIARQLDEAADSGDAALPFFVGAAQDRWREALNSILALGAVAGSAEREAGAAADRLIWTVQADDAGRVLAIEPLEQKAGARGLGKPKAVTLAALLKRTDLAARDAAMLRAVVREPYGNRAVLNRLQAVPALVRHPHVAWHDDPLRFVEVIDALPALEVMTRGEHIQFRVLDPIRPAQASDDDEPLFLTARQRQAWDQRQQVLLLRDGPERARVVRVTPAHLRVAELVTQGWQVPVSAKAELDAALRVLATHFQLASDAEAGTEVPASPVLRAELTPQGGGLALRLVAAPFGDFGPRLGPGSGRERVTTVHQGVTLFTRRDLAAERESMTALVRSVDFLDDGTHSWEINDAEQALALVEALGGLTRQVVSEWPKGKPLRVRALSSPQVRINVTSRGDWLELDGEATLDDGEVLRLRELLERLQQGRSRFIALRDGDFSRSATRCASSSPTCRRWRSRTARARA